MKVEDSWTVNCIADEQTDLAVSEIESTQGMNTRSRLNPTWHLIVSFGDDELSGETLREIESEICDGLGMGDHQRICAVHNDTSNLHFHIALNRVHPETGKFINPGWSKYTMQDIGIAIEKKFQLQPTITESLKKDPSEKSGGHSWEQVSGMESFLSWAKAHCSGVIENATNWESLHAGLAQEGVLLKKRGNGLALVTSDEKHAVKASSVNREFSLKKLENRLGEFQSAKRKFKIETRYSRKPKQMNSQLWNQYQQHIKNTKSAYHSKLDQLRQVRDDSRADIKRRYGELRQQNRRSAKRKRLRKAAYSVMKYNRVSELDAVSTLFSNEVAAAKRQHPYISWYEFLQEEAGQGSADAKLLLQKMAKPNYSRPSIVGNRKKGVSEMHGYHINRYGDVEFMLESGESIIDTGNSILLDRELSDSVVDTGLALSLASFGNNIKVNNDTLKSMIEERIQSGEMTVTLNMVSYIRGERVEQGQQR